jgi:hypothetical protein
MAKSGSSDGGASAPIRDYRIGCGVAWPRRGAPRLACEASRASQYLATVGNRDFSLAPEWYRYVTMSAGIVVVIALLLGIATLLSTVSNTLDHLVHLALDHFRDQREIAKATTRVRVQYTVQLVRPSGAFTLEAGLADLGREGWELVSMLPVAMAADQAPSGVEYQCVFKRIASETGKRSP